MPAAPEIVAHCRAAQFFCVVIKERTMQQLLAYLVNCAAINQVEQQRHFRREREAEAI
jgi:hypothetical protein